MFLNIAAMGSSLPPCGSRPRTALPARPPTAKYSTAVVRNTSTTLVPQCGSQNERAGQAVALINFPFVFQLCQMVRLVPGAYLEYKAALVNECNKQGGLRLAQARALIKIDVNKTRKIYDFLIREGYITKA